MRGRAFLIIAVALASLLLLNACKATVTDTVTEQQMMGMEKPSEALKRVIVETDGMLADGYGSPHPFGLNEEVLVDFDFYDSSGISRGDVVVFKTRNNTDQQTDIARIVALPGETVTIKKGTVYINGNKLDTFYGKDTSSDNNDSLAAVTLKANEYYILADIRWRGMNDSQSTRAGFQKDEILGKVVGYEKK
ncbi:signal peptidase I [Paenibacillus sp. FSL H8-0548]|uniref:signal peptidase I n=1 Tax=Paenibacillus sp. FSL H8-0548 TaxID=1920422 RepID=UPI00096E30B6|nr:signal peptidase I [Paenibacillus sp. FSL H8-0548]OMF24156.1 signal peptidase I [Paenibacillus sp. FSL H8-0548]